MMPGSYPDGPRLLADIGGTNARFALEYAPGRITAMQTLSCAAYERFEDAARAYLDGFGAGARHAVIAIANPVDGDAIKMTNHDWSFSIAAARRELALETLLVVNDFTALAMALPHLCPSQRVRIGGGVEQAGRTIGLIGPGTGLGVSGIVPVAGGWAPLATEGGHVSFAPADDTEIAIVRQLWREFGHASAERLLSGPGLELIYRVISGAQLGAAEITRRAHGGDADCARTVDCFCSVLGSVAGNVALTLGATGGMYIGGGIVPRLGALFAASPFRARFEAKGRMAAYLEKIPTFLITERYPAFLGVSAILSERRH